ncbi:MAG TPA: hypothetical protein VG674_00535 [Amycolatopsis sp.]|nr:hypothetical protein [Amycolatopsis sp.]
MANTDPRFFGLAPEFFENDGQRLLADVANWADLCTAPRGTPVRHPESGIDNHVPDQQPIGGDRTTPWDNRPDNLPMPGLTIDHFFYAARALSGPDLPAFAADAAAHRLLGDGLVNITTNLTHQPGDPNDPHSPARQSSGGQMGLHDALDHLFDHWSGPAKEKCVEYAGSVYDFMTNQQEIIAGAADALLAYCSIILGARKKLINLMGGFVAAMQAKEAEDASKSTGFPWGLLIGVVATVATGGFGLVAAVGTEALVAAVASPLLGVAGSVAGAVLTGQNSITPDDYAAAAHDYLTKADEILNDAREGILAVTKSYSRMEAAYQPPPPPLTKAQFDADHDQLEPDAD